MLIVQNVIYGALSRKVWEGSRQRLCISRTAIRDRNYLTSITSSLLQLIGFVSALSKEPF